MKKYTLLLALLFAFALSYGQQIKQQPPAVPYSTEQKKLEIPDQSRLKTQGEVFYSCTFDFADASNPRGWTLPDGWQVAEEGNFGQYWEWRAGNDSIKGRFTFLPGHIYSKTPEDGYFVLPMDEYNYVDNVSTDNAGRNWFQLPEFDCSTRASVVFKMSQYFRCCCGAPDVKLLVSNDLGVHWASYNMAYETPTNIFCKNPYPEVNVTEVAGGMPHVWFRVVWDSNSEYFWCVDDITLSEAYNNELQLETPWLYMTDLEANSDEGFVYMVPMSQVGPDGFGGYTWRAGFLNAGSNDQSNCLLNVEVFKNGVSVYNQNSTKVTDIWSLQRDTFDVSDPAFVPDGYGDYRMVMTAKQSETDGVPANNVYSDTYYVTDSVYSVSDWDWETYSSSAGWVGGNNDGDYLGILYDIKEPVEVNSISTMIMQRKDNPRASTQVGYSFQNWIFRWDPTDQVWYEVLYGPYTDITEEMLNTWVTSPMEKDGESEFLEPGQYIAAIQGYHYGGASPDNNLYRFTIGSDQSHRFNANKSLVRFITSEEWGSNPDLSMIRMNINNTGAPQSADVTFNVDMTLPIANGFFHPGTDYVDVSGSFNAWDGTAYHLTDPDGDGIYSLTVPAMATFLKFEYKYQINGNPNTTELPAGPVRTYRVSYYNVINDVYNNGISMGIDQNALTASLQVYPNPSEGRFTLSATNTRVADLDIRVTNIEGQTVYHHLVKSVLSYEENIDLTRFAKGMYFLKVNNQVVKLLVE